MPSVCFHFQVHLPDRLCRYRALDIGCSRQYFDTARNEEAARKLAAERILPIGERLLHVIDRHRARFSVAISLSGTALDQLEQQAPEALAVFARLVATGRVELLGETYFHSLSFLYDRHEFERQVAQHKVRMEERFGVRPAAYRGFPTANEPAWLGNAMQQSAAEALYRMRDAIYGANDPAIVSDWQRLTATDHLCAMSTRFSDGGAHEPWNACESPYEAYIAFMNVLNDLMLRIGDRDSARRIVEEPHRLTRSVVPAAVQLH